MNKPLESCVKSGFTHTLVRITPVRMITLFLLFIVLVPFAGCNHSEMEHGAGQQATLKEQEDQNRNLISQVVIAAEELEKHPDPEFLRGAVARLNSWLQKRPETKGFVADSEMKRLEEQFHTLSTLFAEARDLAHKFNDKAKSAQEEDGNKLIECFDKIAASCRELGKEIPTGVFGNLEKIAVDFGQKLKSSKEYQFGNRVDMFRAVVEKYKLPVWYQFDSLARGFDDVADAFKTDAQVFHRADSDYFKQCVWLRNVANWAKGSKQNDLDIAQNLFDWTVKNILIEMGPVPGPAGSISQTPWQTMLLSQGSVMERATVFMELLRQVRLDSFLIQPVKDAPADFPVLVGVRINDDIFLFLPGLGMAIPAKNGLKFNKGLQFDKIATLVQAAADDSILRNLDLSEKEKFPLTAEQLKQVVAMVPTNPFLLAKRMAIMEREFSGQVYTVLSQPLAAQKQKIASLAQVAQVKPAWNELGPIVEQILFPFETASLTQPYVFTMKEGSSLETKGTQAKSEMQQDASPKKKSPLRDAAALNSPLWSGKVLYFKGNFTGENGAAHWLQQGRVSDRILKETSSHLNEDVNIYLGQLAQEYAKENKPLTQEQLQALGQEYVSNAQQVIMTKVYIKVAARFYLALVSLAAGNDDTAVSHLSDMTLITEMNGLWKSGTIYLLARIDKAGGPEAVDKAIGIYRSDKGPSAYGNHLRAKWLTQLVHPDRKITEKEATQTKKPENRSPEKAIDKNTLDRKQTEKSKE
ncbi:MAG: hypothetical protein PHQ75_10180 [Thermoguttaceae bacterium]|nr:hypothetical protein [Thermoguttaceae bacterium]